MPLNTAYGQRQGEISVSSRPIYSKQSHPALHSETLFEKQNKKKLKQYYSD